MYKHHQVHARSKNGTFFLLPYVDVLGMAASTLCLVHCLVLPFVLLAAPGLSAGLLNDERTHCVLALFVLSFCLLGILPGYLRHNQKPVLGLMLVGLSLVLFATFGVASTLGTSWEVPLITAGNLLVVAAHYRNRKLIACSH